MNQNRLLDGTSSRLVLGLLLLAYLGCGWEQVPDTPEPDTPETDVLPVFESDRLRASIVLTVGTKEPPGVICSQAAQATPLRSGAAVEGCGCGEILVFDAAAEYDRSIEMCGEGPAEMYTISSILPSDGLMVAGMPPKLLWYRGDFGDFREITLERPARLKAFLPGRHFLLHYYASTTSNSMLALHLHDLSGKKLRSFYEVETTGDQQVWSSALRPHVAVTDDGRIWTARPENVYELREWDEEGNLLRTIHKRSSWFPSYSEPFGGIRPRINGIGWQDGLLWVVGQRPLEWRDEPIIPPDESFPDLESAREAMNRNAPETEGFIEVIDPRHGETVAAGGFPELGFQGWKGGGPYRLTQDEDGTIRAEFFRAEVLPGEHRR